MNDLPPYIHLLNDDRLFLKQNHETYAQWRRHLHQHPETAFEEVQTAQFVADRLRSFGLEVHEGLAQTGVVAVWRNPRNSSLEQSDHILPRIGLRADLDALPMDEFNTFAHRSIYDGKMHACGHDGHTIMLLAAAHRLSQSPPQNVGEIIFIFQPAEENEAGGRVMVEEGLFDQFPVDAVFGLHNLPGLTLGHFAARVGPQMASADFFKLTLKGKGGHAAWPHQCSDVLVSASQLVLSWQTIVSRKIDPLSPAVVSVTQIHGGQSTNVLPAQVEVTGTVRAFDEATRQQIENQMKAEIDAVCLSGDFEADWQYEHRYTATVNAPLPTEFSLKVAQQCFGASKVDGTPQPLMGAEDFGWMLRARPGCYALLGAGDRPMLHHPHYDFPDELLAHGALYWIQLARTFLRNPLKINDFSLDLSET